MNKILVVGHKQSCYQQIAELLIKCGVSQAVPSQAYGLTGVEINAKLLQASSPIAVDQEAAVLTNNASHGRKNKNLRNRNLHNKAVAQATQAATHYTQRHPKKNFDMLAFDLLLANAESSLWGWADPNAVALLEYWANFDEEMFFVLVYDKPELLCQDALEPDNNTTQIQERWDDWAAYNQALAQFAAKYSTRSVLISAKQAIEDQNKFVQSLIVKGLPLNPVVSNEKVHDESALDLYQQIQENQKRAIFAEQKLAYDIFVMMQNCADLAYRETNDGYEITKEQLIEAYTVLYESKTDQDKALSDQVQNDQTKIAQLQQQIQALNTELAAKKSEIDLLKQKAQSAQASKALTEENNLLIAQLHHTQEELEKYYLENQRLKSTQPQPATNLPSTAVYYGAAERIKQDLPYRLGAAMVSHSKSTKDLAKLPVVLFKEYQDFQKNHENQADLPPIEEYQDAKEAEKVKKHLSYKLGKTLVDGVKSPKSILDLPVKMGKEIVGFKKK